MDKKEGKKLTIEDLIAPKTNNKSNQRNEQCINYNYQKSFSHTQKVKP